MNNLNKYLKKYRSEIEHIQDISQDAWMTRKKALEYIARNPGKFSKGKIGKIRRVLGININYSATNSAQ